MGVSAIGPAIFDILKTSGLPTSLAEVGFRESDIERAAQITVETDNGLNPGPVTLDDVRTLLKDALDGRRPQ
jgi:alcohol dehydrogenase class IV